MGVIIGNGTVLSCLLDSGELLPAVATNNSPSQSKTSVLVTFTLPPGLAFELTQTNAPTQGTFDPGTGVWTVGTMLALTTESFDLEVIVTDSTLRPWTISYTVTCDTCPDDDPSNDTATRSFDATFSCEDFDNCTTLGEAHGDVLYVSVEGDNLTAQKGNPHKPWRDPWTASEAADNNDTVYVYPGTHTIGDAADSPDVEWDGTQNFLFPNRVAPIEANVHWHFDENAAIISKVDDASFKLFDTGGVGVEAFHLTVTGAGSLYIKAGTVFNVPFNTLGETDIELSSYVTDSSKSFGINLDERDHMFMISKFDGHTNIKINSIRSRGPNFLSMTSRSPGHFTGNGIHVDVGTWHIDAPTSLAAEATAGTQDSMLSMESYGSAGNPMNIEFNIGTLISTWKAQGLLVNASMAESGWGIEQVMATFNISTWTHTDALIDDGTPYVIDGDLTPYRSGAVTDTSAPGAMIYLSSPPESGADIDMDVVVNVGTANFNGLLFDNYVNYSEEASTRNTLVFNAQKHEQSGTPFTVRLGSSNEDVGTSKIVVNIMSGLTTGVPFHMENPADLSSGPARYISGNIECSGYVFMRFNDIVANRALILKDLLIVTDQASCTAVLTGGDTNDVVVLSTAANVASDAGLTEKGTPIVVDSNYS